ncbi:MAG: hypothetical protein IJB58_03630 [Bacteroidales bacterium]|nr:hypothetical protein [Bacteroidales bacterium]
MRPVKTSAGIAVRRLALNGQRGIRSVFSICRQVVNTPLLFYSTFGVE